MMKKIILILLITILFVNCGGCINKEPRFVATLEIETHLNHIGIRIIDNVAIIEGEGYNEKENNYIVNKMVTFENEVYPNEIEYNVHHFSKKDTSYETEIRWVRSEPEFIIWKNLRLVTESGIEIIFSSQEFKKYEAIGLPPLKWDYVWTQNLEDIKENRCRIKIFVDFNKEILITELNGEEQHIYSLERRYQ